MTEKTMTYETCFPGRFLKAGLFDGKRVTLTVEAAFMETLEGDNAKKENKLILSFVGKTMQLVTNKTNAYCLKEMFGNKVQDWVGKRIVFYPTDTSFGPKKVDCIRVYGSPDIAADIDINQRIGRKQFKTTLHAVKAAAPATTAQVDPRILAAWDILGWTKGDGAAHRATAGGSESEYLAALNSEVDKLNDADAQ